MGLSAAFVVCPAPVAVQLGLAEPAVASGATAADDWLHFWLPAPGVSSSGPAIFAMVHDSDWCYVYGTTPESTAGTETWSWMFGDPELLAGDPGAADLQSSADGTATAISQWCAAVGRPVANEAAIRELLDGSGPFAEQGFFALVRLLGLLADDAEWEPVGAAGGMATLSGTDFDYPNLQMAPGGWAIAVDHRSPAWLKTIHWADLEGFGEPPAVFVLGASGYTYLASDPPALVGSHMGGVHWVAECVGGTGEWIAIPDEARTSVESAAAWVRANVGRAGVPASPDRPFLNVELGLDASWDHYAVAPAEEVWLRVRSGGDLSSVVNELADWMHEAHGVLVAPIVDRWPADLVQTHIDPHEQISGPPAGLLVHTCGWTPKSRPNFGDGDERGWNRKLGQLRTGKLSSLTLDLSCMNLAGRASAVRGSAAITVNVDPQFDYTGTHLLGRPKPPVRVSASVAVRLLEHLEQPIDTMRDLAADALRRVARADATARAIVATGRRFHEPEVVVHALGPA